MWSELRRRGDMSPYHPAWKDADRCVRAIAPMTYTAPSCSPHARGAPQEQAVTHTRAHARPTQVDEALFDRRARGGVPAQDALAGTSRPLPLSLPPPRPKPPLGPARADHNRRHSRRGHVQPQRLAALVLLAHAPRREPGPARPPAPASRPACALTLPCGRGQGRKWWALCGRNEGQGPRPGAFECFEDILRPGDTLYYPRGWYHQASTRMPPR
jgi:hypothetical protein